MPISPYSFAWVTPTETVFGPEHLREDEKIAALSFEQNEGDFGALTIDVRNKRDGGLLQAGRRQWCWLGYNGAPIFFGRLVGVPTDLTRNMIKLMFVARPQDYVALKVAVATSLKVAGYYDALFIDDAHLADPDTVLEGYGALWSFDPVTHVVGYSDYLVGEDGTEDFLSNEVPGDSLGQHLSQSTARSVIVDAVFNWTQEATGTVQIVSDETIFSYTGLDLINDWPKVGANLQGGWSVESSSANDDYKINEVVNNEFSWQWHNTAREHRNGDTMSDSGSSSTPMFNGPFLTTDLTFSFQSGINDPYSDPPINIDSHAESTSFYVPLWKVTLNLTLRYTVARKRQERVRFKMKANLQPLVTLPDEDDAETIALSSNDAGAIIPGDIEAPIVDIRRRSYVTTDRGIKSLEYVLNRGAAWLKIKARAVETNWDCSFERAIALRTRKNARLFDPRMPGGVILGKIIKYSWFSDGEAKKRGGAVTIGSAIGYGDAVAPVAGTPVYVNEGYFVTGTVQQYVGRVVALPSGNVGYSVPIDEPADDGIEFTRQIEKAHVVTVEVINGNLAAQKAAILAGFQTDIAIANLDSNPVEANRQKLALIDANKKSTIERLKALPISKEIHLKPLNVGPFETLFDLVTTDIEFPKQVDLEVATAAGRLRTHDGGDVASVAGTVT